MHPRLRPLVASSFALALALVAPAARADVLYDTFGPGDSYSGTAGYPLGLSFRPDQPLDIAMGFTVTGGDFYFTSFQAAILGNGSPLSFDLIAADGLGGGPGTVLESITVATEIGASIVMGTASGSVRLLEGETYYLATDVLAFGLFEGAWMFASPEMRGLVAGNYNDGAGWAFGPDGPLAAFRINGASTTVPEPAGLMLASTALAALGVVASRRCRPTPGRPAGR